MYSQQSVVSAKSRRFEDSQFLRAEVFDAQNAYLLAVVVEIDPRFQSAVATLQNPL